MSHQTSHKTTTTTYRTVTAAPAETSYRTMTTTPVETAYRTVTAAPVETAYRTVATTPVETAYRTVTAAPVETVSGGVMQIGSMTQVPRAIDGYESVRYLVPVQQAMPQQSYVLMQQPMVQPVAQTMVQSVAQPMVSQVYVQRVPYLSASSQESDLLYQQQSMLESTSRASSSVFSQSSSPIKSPEPGVYEEEEVVEEEEEEEDAVEVEEVEIVNVIQQKPPPVIEKLSRMELKTELKEVSQPTKLDTRYFGELLAEVYRKNCDIHSCISDHVSKIRGHKHYLDLSNDYKVEKQEVESLLPKGASELTKQQIRYLLQTRLTADKSMRLLLSTFSSLREELLHLSEDIRRLENEKESLERDLSFKADQARQYDSLLEALRENNRQLQLSLKEATLSQRTLESQVLSSRDTDTSREFRIKELEGKLRALEKDNEMLREKLSGKFSNSTLQAKTDELSQHYNEQLTTLRQEKDQEIQRLRSQLTQVKTEITTVKSSSETSLQLKISQLIAMLEERQTTITKQEEEIKRLKQERNDSTKNVTKTIITKRYRNQYPILGLLSDDYQVTSPVKEAKTIVIERTGEMIKQEIITTP